MLLTLLQEKLLTSYTFDTQRVLESIIPAIIVGILTYALARRKNNSEISKNEADVEKSHAETVKIYIDMISALNVELGNWITQVKQLRSEADKASEEHEETEKEAKKAKTDYEDDIAALNYAFKRERSSVTEKLTELIKELEEHLNDLISHGIAQPVRMRAILILEGLHNLKEALSKPLKNDDPYES